MGRRTLPKFRQPFGSSPPFALCSPNGFRLAPEEFTAIVEASAQVSHA
jgi:hypothetical protein